MEEIPAGNHDFYFDELVLHPVLSCLSKFACSPCKRQDRNRWMMMFATSTMFVNLLIYPLQKLTLLLLTTKVLA